MSDTSNPLASYFQNSSDLFGKDVPGSTFFDIIGQETTNIEQKPYDSENDWIYDYWPSSRDTSIVSPKQPYTSNSLFYSNPQFAFQEYLEDPIRQLIIKFYGAQEATKRLLPTADSVNADTSGLEKLIKSGCFRSVVDLTMKILKNISISNDRKSYELALQTWYLRFSMLYKLKLFKEAEIELKQFDNFDKNEFYYEYFNDVYPNRKGSMVPFGLRLLKAELGVYLKRSDDAICELYAILSVVNGIIKELEHSTKAVEVWNIRKLNVLMAIVNVLVNNQDYDKAIVLLEQICSSNYSNKAAIWSCIGKVLIQIGDVTGASNAFLKAKQHSNIERPSDMCRNLINVSLLNIANGLYQEAYESFEQANKILPDNSLIINNMSLCLFYTGRLRDAIKMLETHIFKNPSKQLNEGLLFNLCTLYELESSKAQQKKLNLLLWLNIYVGNGFQENSLKLS